MELRNPAGDFSFEAVLLDVSIFQEDDFSYLLVLATELIVIGLRHEHRTLLLLVPVYNESSRLS